MFLLTLEKKQKGTTQITYYNQSDLFPEEIKEVMDLIKGYLKEENTNMFATSHLYVIDGYTNEAFNTLKDNLKNVKEDSKTVLISQNRLTKELLPYLFLPISGMISTMYFKENSKIVMKDFLEFGIFLEPKMNQYISDAIIDKKKRKTPIKNLNLRETQVRKVLTEKEFNVLTWILHGYSNDEIADRLNLSSSTVANKISSIIKHLNVNSRTSIVSNVIKRGWITGAK